MKTLPDNPNLDHLRQQAKDLLAGLRDSALDASLADAQASLAGQYGFRGWTDLKAEVDRAHGRAEVADPDLAGEIAARYRLGEVTAPMRSLARADELGRPWSLETARGRWAVRTTDTWVPIVDTETEVALQQAAAEAGVLLPAPVRSHSGAIVEPIAGHRWRVNEWLHSGPPLTAPASATVTYAVGGILGRIHRLGLPVDRVSPWHAYRLSAVGWPELAARAAAGDAGWAATLAAAVPALVELDTIGEHPPPAGPVLCHNALGPGNVRHGANGRLIVVGWEHAGGQPPGWELSDALLHWTVDPGGGVNEPGVRAMLDGYRSAAGCLPELDLTTFSGAATSLANYVFGEVSQALSARDDEQRRHTDRSVRHLLAHLPSRSILERILNVAQIAVRGAGRLG